MILNTAGTHRSQSWLQLKQKTPKIKCQDLVLIWCASDHNLITTFQSISTPEFAKNKKQFGDRWNIKVLHQSCLQKYKHDVKNSTSPYHCPGCSPSRWQCTTCRLGTECQMWASRQDGRDLTRLQGWTAAPTPDPSHREARCNRTGSPPVSHGAMSGAGWSHSAGTGQHRWCKSPYLMGWERRREKSKYESSRAWNAKHFHFILSPYAKTPYWDDVGGYVVISLQIVDHVCFSFAAFMIWMLYLAILQMDCLTTACAALVRY